jgi:hypothetical protein
MEGTDRDLLRLDYEQTTEVIRGLTEIRFRLLAFVPTIAGATVGLLSDPSSAAQLVGVGLFGFVATTGILMYELRNTQLYDAALERARTLERKLLLPSPSAPDAIAGVFSERPRETVRLVGLVSVWHRRGLALVYAAALAGWGYLVGWGVLSAAEVNWAQEWGAALGLIAGVVVVVDLERSPRRGE